jgi:hypothetical protein
VFLYVIICVLISNLFLKSQKVSLDRCSNHNGDEQSSIKSQLKCVNVIRKCVESRLSILKEGGGSSTDWTDDGEGWQNYFLTPGIKLHSLSLVQVLNNSVAVSYFLDYMNSVGGTNYLLMYFNLSGKLCMINVFTIHTKIELILVYMYFSLEKFGRSTICCG